MHLAANTGIRKQLLNIHQARFGAINFVFAGAIAEHAAGDRHFRVFDRQRAVRIIDGEGDFGAPQRFAITSAGEDDVLHLSAAQRLGASLTHNPGQSVHHIGLAGAIWPDDGANSWLEFQRRRRRE